MKPTLEMFDAVCDMLTLGLSDYDDELVGMTRQAFIGHATQVRYEKFGEEIARQDRYKQYLALKAEFEGTKNDNHN